LEPVLAGASFPASIIEMCENVWCKPTQKHQAQMKAKQEKREKMSKKVELDTDRFDPNHPFAVGASIIRDARLFELNEQVRTDDPPHMKFVTGLYRCRRPTLQDLQQIPILSNKDFTDPNSPWFRAPIIVLTHRERYSLTHHAAIRFAKATGKPVIRWKAHTENWRQAPPEHLKHEAYSDPCFYEYWVEDAQAYLTACISKKLGLVNSQTFICHSLTMHSLEQQHSLNQRILSSRPGEIITLPQEPLAINVRLEIDKFDKEQLQNMEHYRLSLSTDNSTPGDEPNTPDAPEEEKDSYSDSEFLPSVPTPPPPRFMGQGFRIPRKKKSTDDEMQQPDHHDAKKDVLFVIPITAGKTKTTEQVPVYGTSNIKPSEINIKPHFPFQLSFVMTVNKSEGQTMPKAILALSQRKDSSFNFNFRGLYVANSRVRKREDNRLLLYGKGHNKLLSIHYLTTLRPPLDSLCVLKGFAARGGKGWRDDVWNPEETLRRWELASQK
jgi:hypothetical protein